MFDVFFQKLYPHLRDKSLLWLCRKGTQTALTEKKMIQIIQVLRFELKFNSRIERLTNRLRQVE